MFHAAKTASEFPYLPLHDIGMRPSQAWSLQREMGDDGIDFGPIPQRQRVDIVQGPSEENHLEHRCPE